MRKPICFVLVLVMILSLIPSLYVSAWTYDEFQLPDTIGVLGKNAVIKDVQDYVSEDKVRGLFYASESYEDNLAKAPCITFYTANFYKEYTLDKTPLVTTGSNQYNLEFLVPTDLTGGNYKVVIDLYTADQKGINPFRFTIDRFVVEDNTKDCYEVFIDKIYAEHSDTIVIENFQNYISSERLSSLFYVSDYYDDVLEETTIENFLSDYNKNTLTYDSSPVKYLGDDNYTLKVPVNFSSKETWRVVIHLPAAPGSGDINTKPYKITIDNLVTTENGNHTSEYKAFLPDIYVENGNSATVKNVDQYCPDYVAEKLKKIVDNSSSYSGMDVKYTFKQGSTTVYSTLWEDTLPVKYTNNNYQLGIVYSSKLKPGTYSLAIDMGYHTTNMGFLREVTLYCCNYIMKDDEIPHKCTWDEGVVTTKPGCETPGETTFTCTSGCGATYTKPIDAIGHSWGDWYVQAAPTSTKTGVEIQKCKNCFATETREIPAIGEKNTTFNIADTVTLSQISGAEIFVTSEDGTFSDKCISDGEGKAAFDLANGFYSVQVIKSGYQLRNFTIEKKDSSSSFDVYLNKYDILQVNTQVKEMDRQEIIEAGIDINAPENQHVYECITVLQFTPVAPGGSFNPTPITIDLNYYCNEEGSVINPKPIPVSGGIVIYPVSRDIYLIVYSKTTWLKEMFDVQLVVANTSSVETIENCQAELFLPEGLSLAKMVEEEQSSSVFLGSIDPLLTMEHHWYLCGDVAGEYYISGLVNGTRVSGAIMEKVETKFITQEPICVLAGDAMQLTIEAEKFAVVGTPYRMRYTLQNVSGKTLNNVNLVIPGGKFCKAYDVEEVIHKIELGDTSDLTGTFNDGYQLSKEEFKPGEVLSGVFEITFGTGVETEYITYMVKDMFTLTGNNSTTEIPTTIRLVDNIEKHRWNQGDIIKEASCTQEGEILYSCLDQNCSETKTVVLSIKDHSLSSWQVTTNATCTKKGEKIRSCADCDYVITSETDKEPHSYSSGKITTAPTETTAGVIEYQCVNCGEIQTSHLSLMAAEGNNWKLYDNGLLVISGNNGTISPTWLNYASQISIAYFEDGVTKIGDAFFAGCTNLEEVYVSEGVRSISDQAFSDCPNLKKFHYNGNREQLSAIMTLGENAFIKDERITYGKPSLAYGDGNIDIYAPEEEVVLLVAIYDGDIFVGFQQVRVKASMKKPLEELGLSVENAGTIKAFLWKNLEVFKPICGKQESPLAP